MKIQVQIGWDLERPIQQSCSELMPEMAAGFFASGRSAAEEGTAIEELHAFRLLAKRMRYTLELVEPCYPNGLTERIGQVKRLQDTLGEINDCDVALGLLSDPAEPDDAEIKRLRVFLEERLHEKIREFRRFWREEFDAAGWLESWQRELAQADE